MCLFELPYIDKCVDTSDQMSFFTCPLAHTQKHIPNVMPMINIILLITNVFFIIKNLTCNNSTSYPPAQPINLKNNFDKFFFFDSFCLRRFCKVIKRKAILPNFNPYFFLVRHILI
jgi:hypothetical protein